MGGQDRAGKQRLYSAEPDGELLFAAEIRALLAPPGVPRDADLEALTRYLLYGYFPAPHTPFRGIRKLPAGHLLLAENGRTRLQPYWDLRAVVAAGAVGAARAGGGGATRVDEGE